MRLKGGAQTQLSRPGLARIEVPVTPVDSPAERSHKEDTMGLGKKFHNAAEKIHGKGKEASGEVTGSDRLKAEGRGHQVKADLKQAGEKVKDAFRRH
jgi:uncharacterized protein YjbJ (UPF0337 family)